jgi:hypothetical protein
MLEDPTEGARVREGLLLAAYFVLAVIGVWTVVVSELSTQDPARREGSPVPLSAQKSTPAGN